jgi:hypothetical protein
MTLLRHKHRQGFGAVSSSPAAAAEHVSPSGQVPAAMEAAPVMEQALVVIAQATADLQPDV